MYTIENGCFFLSPKINPENICYQIEKGFHINEKFLIVHAFKTRKVKTRYIFNKFLRFQIDIMVKYEYIQKLKFEDTSLPT